MPARPVDTRPPEFGKPATPPPLSREICAARLDALGRVRRAAGIDALLIYADQAHSANFSWVTGFAPLLEEAALIIAPGMTPTLLAGPETLARAHAIGIEVEARLYPPFGLLGQDRSQTPALREVLENAGLGARQRIGVLGWKYFGPDEAAKPETWLETPSYIVDTLRHIAGPEGKVVNANALLMDPAHGLRAIGE